MWQSIVFLIAVIGCIYASQIPQYEDDSTESISNSEQEQRLGWSTSQPFSKIKFSRFSPFPQINFPPFPKMNFPPFPKTNFPSFQKIEFLPFPKMLFPPFPKMKPIAPLDLKNAVGGSAMGFGSPNSVTSGVGASMTSTTTLVDGKPITKTQGVIIKNDNGRVTEEHFGS